MCMGCTWLQHTLQEAVKLTTTLHAHTLGSSRSRERNSMSGCPRQIEDSLMPRSLQFHVLVHMVASLNSPKLCLLVHIDVRPLHS